MARSQKKSMGCFGWMVLVVLGFIGLAIFSSGNKPNNNEAKNQKEQDQNNQNRNDTPKINASLSDFKIDSESSQFVFTLKLSNPEPQEKTVYVVVYGKNDAFSPPRRGAWPFGGLLFKQAGTNRGALSSSNVSDNWQSRPDTSKGKKIVLEPNGSDSTEGALPINQVSPHEAWRGQPLDRRSIYNEVYLWVYSKDGQLIFEKNYNLE